MVARPRTAESIVSQLTVVKLDILLRSAKWHCFNSYVMPMRICSQNLHRLSIVYLRLLAKVLRSRASCERHTLAGQAFTRTYWHSRVSTIIISLELKLQQPYANLSINLKWQRLYNDFVKGSLLRSFKRSTQDSTRQLLIIFFNHQG